MTIIIFATEERRVLPSQPILRPWSRGLLCHARFGARDLAQAIDPLRHDCGALVHQVSA